MYGGSAALMGRDAELASLKRARDEAVTTGRLRMVTLVGAPGMGKTRLLDELTRELAASGSLPRVYRGRAREGGARHGVFAGLLRQRFGVYEGLEAEAARGRVRGEVARVLSDRKVEDVAHFLGQIMDLEFRDSPLTRALADDPVQAGLVQRAVIKSFFESDATVEPLCLVFEDLHAADEDSLELLRYLADTIQAPILILATARAELLARQQDFADLARGRHELLELGPLPAPVADALAREMLQRCQGGPPAELASAATRLAGGNPGLIEQMVRVFHDVGVLTAESPAPDSPWRVNLERLASARLPLTVEDAVAARVASLTPELRRVLEQGAAVGSVFWRGALIALGRLDQPAPELWRTGEAMDDAALDAALAELVKRDYLLRLPDSAFPAETEYVFKHNLEREKLLSLTAVATLRRYHQQIADWLSQQAGARNQEESLVMLARHLSSAGSHIQAGEAYLKAGSVARAGFGWKKAAEYFERGLALLGETDAGRRLSALHDHGDVLFVAGRTEEALTQFREMLRLAFQLNLKSKGGAAHNRIGRVHRETGDLAQAEEHLKAGLELFREAEDERGVAASHDDLGRVLWIKSDYSAALKQLKTALEIRRRLGDRRSIALSLNNIGQVWMDHGRAAKAQEALEAALGIRREINDPLGIVESLVNLGRIARQQADHARALSLFDEAHEVAREMGERGRIAEVLTNLGETRAAMGESGEALKVLEQAERICEELGDKLNLGEVKRAQAEAHLKMGQLRPARDAIKLAVDLFGRVRSKAHLAVALRSLADVTAAGAWGEGHEGKAVDYYMRSIALCKEIGNELEEARSYRAFAAYVTTSAHYRDNGDIQREAARLGAMADEIFKRLKVGPLGTRPGGSVFPPPA
ncbi:MAG: tetratricopeptide repeat protein [Polyangiaceae bacterium]|nr:tetratricopeptide repeat protein [Polyangiaceae bacterium]MCW5791418.1 tetratricopeptide repeat protein [Polyangiaceae bacterium]